jgi:hypothetical protein
MRAHFAAAMAAMILVVVAAWSQTAAAGEATLTLDNDFFAGFDRHYTNGFQIAILASTASLPGPVLALQPFGAAIDSRYTFAVGQRIYTPASTTTDFADPRDRPYAGWLYALAEFRARRDYALDHFMVSVGVVGPASLGRQAQNAVHRLLGEDGSRGWNAQLHNEPALLLAYERAWPAIASVSMHRLNLDFTPRVSATVGNVFTYASVGAIARLGHNLPDDFPAAHISLGPARDGYRANAGRRGWYAWAGTDARLVARNVFLDGNTFRDSPSVERKRFVWDLQVGVARTWGLQRLGFAIVRRSEEFAGQGKSDKFGQLTYSFAY